MIRQPTTIWKALAWHRNYLNGRDVPRHEDEPQCGYYRRRFVKGGPYVPVRIYMLQEVDDVTGELTEPEVLRADQNGEPADPVRIWSHLHPISEEQYLALVQEHAANPKMKATHVAVDLSREAIRP